MPDQQSLPQGSAEGINDADGPLRIFLLQFLGGNDSGLVSGRQSGREAQRQHIFPLVQGALHQIRPILRVCRRGGCHDTAAQLIIECFHSDRVGKIIVALAVISHGEAGTGNVVFFVLRGIEVAAGIGNDLIAHW